MRMSTSPSPGSGVGLSVNSKLSRLGTPSGRLFSKIWRLTFLTIDTLLQVATIKLKLMSGGRHKPLSTQRLSEYPTDYFVGICIETSAMAQQNTLWLPRVDFSDCRLRLPPLEE